MDSNTNGRPIVCVFGSYSPKPGEPAFEEAYSVGYALAKAGYVVANGGYNGTMLASAKGAKDAGGSTLGVTCSIFRDSQGRPLQPNPYIDREVPYHDLLARITAMMNLSVGYVALAGGTGTLTELAIVWEFVCKGLIPPRPVFIVGDFWRSVVETIAAVRPEHAACVYRVATADEIVTQLRQSGSM